MHKMMFPFENWNSVSNGSFREVRPCSVIAEYHWPYYRFERVPVDRGASGEADRIGFSMKAQLLLRRADRFVFHLEYNNINNSIYKYTGAVVNCRSAARASPTCTNTPVQMQIKCPLKMLTKVGFPTQPPLVGQDRKSVV